MNRKLLLILSGAIIVGLLAGVVLSFIEARYSTRKESSASTEVIVQQSSYVLYSREEMIDKAASIFVGKVLNISTTRWNQDSGEYWDDGFQYHTIDLEVIQPIVEAPGTGKKEVTLTVLGVSPLDGIADHSLKIGDQGVFFVRKTELAWRDGTRSVIELVGVPTDSYFLRKNDGLYQGRLNEQPYTLTQLIEKIAQRREVLKITQGP